MEIRRRIETFDISNGENKKKCVVEHEGDNNTN